MNQNDLTVLTLEKGNPELQIMETLADLNANFFELLQDTANFI